MSIVSTEPPTVHRGEDELPFVNLGDGSLLQVLQVDLGAGIWIIRNRFVPGTSVQRHRHTGAVYAFTQSGSWHYIESPDSVNTAGSYLYEPAGSVHTLTVPDTNEGLTDVWFTIHGANLNLRDDDSVEMVIDAQTVLDFYRAMCEAEHGLADPPVIVLGA